jgi:CTP:molybdopterin cytidylyltransferase MocA
VIGCVILAAGAGTRLGGVAKALLGSPTFLERIVRTATADDVVVVIGPPFGDAVAGEAARLGARTVVNPDPARGMASSIALGFSAVRGDAAWLWPVDHPHVRAQTLGILKGALGDHDLARPRYRGRGGHPPLVAARVWPALVAMTATAREVFAAARVCEVDVDDPGCTRDIDLPEDL